MQWPSSYQAMDVRSLLTDEVLRMERNSFKVRFGVTLGAYVGLTLWLASIRSTAPIWPLWALIAAQWIFFFSIFVVCLGRAKQCAFRHSWLLVVALVLSRVKDWELVILPALALTMLVVSARNRNVAIEHSHMLQSSLFH